MPGTQIIRVSWNTSNRGRTCPTGENPGLGRALGPVSKRRRGEGGLAHESLPPDDTAGFTSDTHGIQQLTVREISLILRRYGVDHSTSSPGQHPHEGAPYHTRSITDLPPHPRSLARCVFAQGEAGEGDELTSKELTDLRQR